MAGKVPEGKFSRLRRLRVGVTRVPVEHPERIRGPRARNAERLKVLVGRIVDESRSGVPYYDVEAYEPPDPPKRTLASPARPSVPFQFDEDDE